MSLFFLPDLPASVLMISSFPESSGISISSVTVIFGPVRSEVLAASLTKLPEPRKADDGLNAHHSSSNETGGSGS